MKWFAGDPFPTIMLVFYRSEAGNITAGYDISLNGRGSERRDAMKILEDVYLVGGGLYGIGTSCDLDCNVFVIDGGDEIMLIDAGVGVDTHKIMMNIEKESLVTSKIKKLVLTHTHLDHAGGAADFKDLLGLQIYVSDKEAAYLEEGNEDAIGLTQAKKVKVYPEDYRLKKVNVDHRLQGGESIRVGKYTIDVISTPGHSKGSISLLLKGHEKKILFSGDTVFMGGTLCLLNLPDSSLTDYKEGIGNLKDLSIDCLLPGHAGFTLSNGQVHINMAIQALEGLGVPKMFI